MIIDSVRLYRLNAFLTKPYHTAFGDLEYFDATVALVAAGENMAAGESTAVFGYSWESPDDVWDFITAQAPLVLGRETKAARNELSSFEQTHPFGVTPLLSAIEILDGEFSYPQKDWRFPLVGILNTAVKEEIPAMLERLLEEGFTTIKFKIGFDVDRDIHKIKLIQSLLGGRGLLRLDANQMYTLEQAQRLVREVPPDYIELLEQPFKAGDWETMERFAPQCPLPLMLDESIYNAQSISRVLETGCASYIKLKVMKSGGLCTLRDQALQVTEKGLKLVIGNGAATDISCAHELLVGRQAGLEAAGEMNGYLKMRLPLISNTLGFDKGQAMLKSGGTMLPEADMLEEQAVASVLLL